MEEQLNRLVDKAWALHQVLPPSKRLLIAIGGIPGSGKTTLATSLVDSLNARAAKSSPSTSAGTKTPLAAHLPMDGFHLTRAQLSALPDPENAHKRRGAAFTFDAPAYLSLVRKLRESITPESGSILAPSFDHAVKDPVEGDIRIGREVKIVVLEGNYLALNTGEWKEAGGLCDEVWFVECDEAVARRRLVKRHVASGIEKDEESAGRRADENDLVNGREIVRDRWDGVTEAIKGDVV